MSGVLARLAQAGASATGRLRPRLASRFEPVPAPGAGVATGLAVGPDAAGGPDRWSGVAHRALARDGSGGPDPVTGPWMTGAWAGREAIDEPADQGFVEFGDHCAADPHQAVGWTFPALIGSVDPGRGDRSGESGEPGAASRSGVLHRSGLVPPGAAADSAASSAGTIRDDAGPAGVAGGTGGMNTGGPGGRTDAWADHSIGALRPAPGLRPSSGPGPGFADGSNDSTGTAIADRPGAGRARGVFGDQAAAAFPGSAGQSTRAGQERPTRSRLEARRTEGSDPFRPGPALTPGPGPVLRGSPPVPPPAIEVHIARLDVRAATPAARVSGPPPRPPGPDRAATLNGYLRQRAKGGRR